MSTVNVTEARVTNLLLERQGWVKKKKAYSSMCNDEIKRIDAEIAEMIAPKTQETVAYDNGTTPATPPPVADSPVTESV